MTTLDWIVMIATIVAIPSFGLWRGRRSKTVKDYLLAGKTMPWYAMGLSIMATQASAVTSHWSSVQARWCGSKAPWLWKCAQSWSPQKSDATDDAASHRCSPGRARRPGWRR